MARTVIILIVHCSLFIAIIELFVHVALITLLIAIFRFPIDHNDPEMCAIKILKRGEKKGISKPLRNKNLSHRNSVINVHPKPNQIALLS